MAVTPDAIQIQHLLDDVRTAQSALTHRGLEAGDRASITNDLNGSLDQLMNMDPNVLRANGDAVRLVQDELRKRGFDPGTTDGQWGPKTQAAWNRLHPPAPAPAPAPAAPPASGNGNRQQAPLPSGPPPVPSSAPPAQTQQQVNDYINSTYGYLGAFLNIPEVGDLLRQGATEHWSQEQLTAHLQATDWYKQHSDSQRQWDAQKLLDPRSAQQRIDQQQATIQAIAMKQGISLSADRLKQLADDSLGFSWNNDQLNSAIGAEFHYDPNNPAPQARDIIALGRQYLLPMSQDKIQDYTRRIYSGQATMDSVKADMAQQAKSLYPAMSTSIDEGSTPSQFVDPYRQVAARELEISPDSMDFLDPKWNKAINQFDPQSKQRVAMSLSDWTNEIHSNPTYGYDLTSGAKQQAATFETQLLSKMGAVR